MKKFVIYVAVGFMAGYLVVAALCLLGLARSVFIVGSAIVDQFTSQTPYGIL